MSGDKLPPYSPCTKCPKCGHDDIHTRYVAHGGRYGQPCEFKSYRENEHLHRYCRRCSYEWCEACLAASNVIEQETKTDPALQNPHIAKLHELRNALSGLSDLSYQFNKYANAYKLLLSKYAKFHVGDRVRLVLTPKISEADSPGWIGSRHFLVVGACGEIRDVDVRKDTFTYHVEFDSESWIDSNGVVNLVEPERRHTYNFSERYLEAE